MDLRVYEILFQFNQGFDQALTSLDRLEKLELNSPDYVSKVRTNLSELRAYANNHFACKIAQREQEEENRFYRVRRKREKAEEGPDEIYLELKAREWLRRERGLPPRAVILPWTQADDDLIIAKQKPVQSPLPLQAEHSQPTSGDAKQEAQEGSIQP
jgi:hypothetical protein